MIIQVSESFLASLVGTPLQEGAATGSSALDSKQRAVTIGEVVPIVFCRRIDETGGMLISPPATEARFEDADPSGDVTAYYHLVLSEGQIDPIQVRDVFQRACRVGSYTQTFNRRAGTFVPGNFINNSPNLEAPYYCGTGGTYAGLSTMAFNVTIPAGFDQWDRQVHCFIRGGMRVTRLLDSTLGPSNNVVDLLLYLLRNSSRVSDEQIDIASLTTAARFTDANGFWFNGVVAQSANLRDWMNDVLQYYLLRSVRVAGKEALRPLLPYVASTGAIYAGAVRWAFTFTEEHIVPGSFQINYTSLADRKPFCAVILWRQQPTDDIGLIRSTEVRYAGTALSGPFEQHDISQYCAYEDHAVKIGAYILSRRKHITHTLTITVRPDSFNPTLAIGDLVRVRLERTPSTGASSLHNYLYEIDRIGKNLSGEVLLEMTEFPVDSQLRSVVALEVDGASGNGITLTTSKSGVTCDVNSFNDFSIPLDTSIDIGNYDIPAFDFDGNPININLGDESDLDDAFDSSVDDFNSVGLPDFEFDGAETGIYTGISGTGGFSGDGNSNPEDELDSQDTEVAPFIDLFLSLSEPTVSSICLNSLYEVTFEATVVRAPSVSDYAVVFSLNNAEVFKIPADESGPVEVKFVHNLLNDALPQTYSIDIEGVSDGEGGENISLGTQDFTVELDLDEPVAIKAIVVDEEPALCTSNIAVPTSIPFFGAVSPPILAATGGPFDDPIMTFPPVAGGVKRILSLLDNQLVLGTNPFTIEFWFNKVAAINIFSQPIVDFGDTPDFADTIANIAVGAAGGVGSPETVFISIFDSNFNSGDWELGPITPDTWYHIAIVRDTTEIRAYLGGVEIPPDYVSGPIHEADFNIGGFDFNATNSTNGRDYRINQFAITKDVAKYSDNFTPPSERI